MNTYQSIGQITAWVFDFLDARKSTDLAEENGGGKIQFVGGWHR